MTSKWVVKALEEIADLTGGSTPSREKHEYWDGEIPWVTPTDLPMPGKGIATLTTAKQTITSIGLDACASKLLSPGTVLFSSRATIGKLGILNAPMATNQGFVNLTPKPGISSRFLAYSLLHNTEQIERMAGSTTFREVSRGNIRKFRIEIPSLSEQGRIVAILDAAEALRSLREQADRRTADLIPALFHEMFGTPDKNTKGWPVKALAQVAELTSGGTPSKENPAFWNGAIPWLSAKDMKASEAYDAEDHVTELALEKTTLKRIPANQILVVVRGMILAHTLPLCITRIPVTINQDLKAIMPDEKILDSDYLLWALKALCPVLLAKVSSAGHGTKKLDVPRLIETPVTLPPLPLQRDFAARVAGIRTMEASQAASRRCLDALFQSLLHRAFRGEL